MVTPGVTCVVDTAMFLERCFKTSENLVAKPNIHENGWLKHQELDVTVHYILNLSVKFYLV